MVILIYCFIKSFSNLSVWTVVIVVLCFSFFVEFSQRFKSSLKTWFGKL
ncbi:hypothetical protein [Flavobacterium seoulense]